MAARFEGLPLSCDVVAVMDARCRQVYTALFAVENGTVSRLTPDEAITLDELAVRLKERTRPIIAVGDGAALCVAELAAEVPLLQPAPVGLIDQSAVGIARAAVPLFAKGEVVSGDTLLPVYLRLPQAERELRRRMAESQ